MSELMSDVLGWDTDTEMRRFWMNEIVVDGIEGSNDSPWTGWMFDQKNDYSDYETTYVDEDGLEWIDDTKYTVEWDGPSIMIFSVETNEDELDAFVKGEYHF